MLFSQKIKVPYYECDEKGRMRLSAAVRAMQMVGGEHLNHLNLPYEKLYRENMVFLLAKTCLSVSRIPLGDEELTISTCPVASKGAKFVREAIIEDKAGQRCLSIMTLWMLVDPHSRKILRPSAFPYTLPFKPSIVEDKVRDEKFPKIGDEKPDTIENIAVKYSQIDNNGHVNNSYYIDFACDMVPYETMLGKEIDRFMIAYQNEAVIGETIENRFYKLPDNTYHIVGRKQGDSPCFEVLLTFKN